MTSSPLLFSDPTVPRLIPPADEVRIAVALCEIQVEHGDVVVPLHQYLLFGIPPGAFFDAVLRNDLRHAWIVGTEKNRAALGRYVTLLREIAPRAAWGTKDAVGQWMQKGLALRAWARMGRSSSRSEKRVHEEDATDARHRKG